MNFQIEQFQKALNQNKALKVIAGIANFDRDSVMRIAYAAQAGGADAVDVAADPAIIEEVKRTTRLAVFASSIHPQSLACAVDCGADVAEIGNYDALYAEGLYFTFDEVLRLAEETLAYTRGKALLSVTIPGHLSLNTQARMAQTLQSMGVDILQTEGASRVLAAEPRIKVLTSMEKAELTLMNTRYLVDNCSLPIMAASGMGPENVHNALMAGASAVGVGSVVTRLASEAAMITAIQDIKTRIHLFQKLEPVYSCVS